METVFFSSFLDTVAATHMTKIASRAIFVATGFCRDDQTWSCCINMCELIHLIVWEAKKRVVSHDVVSCRLCVNWPLINPQHMRRSVV